MTQRITKRPNVSCSCQGIDKMFFIVIPKDTTTKRNMQADGGKKLAFDNKFTIGLQPVYDTVQQVLPVECPMVDRCL